MTGALIVCSEPRSYSNSFCLAMRAAGIEALHEHMHHAVRRELAEKFDLAFNAQSPDAFLPAIAERIAPAPFASKVFSRHLKLHPTLLSQFTTRRHIFLYRRDQKARLISLVALQWTGRPLDGPAVYGSGRVGEITAHDLYATAQAMRIASRFWRHYLRDRDALPIAAEDLAEAPEKFVEPIGALLGELDMDWDGEAFVSALRGTRKYSQDAELKSKIYERFKNEIDGIDVTHLGGWIE